MYEVLGAGEPREFTSKAGNRIAVVELYLQDLKKSKVTRYGIAVKQVEVWRNLADPTIYQTALTLKEGDKILLNYDERGQLVDILPMN